VSGVARTLLILTAFQRGDRLFSLNFGNRFNGFSRSQKMETVKTVNKTENRYLITALKRGENETRSNYTPMPNTLRRTYTPDPNPYTLVSQRARI
jgi:hypothetical protein